MPRLEMADGRPVGSPIRHFTTSRIISGSVAVQFTATPSARFDGTTMLIESITEPSEDTIGTAGKLEVIHLERPYEWVAPAYDGGQVVVTVAEVQTPGRRSPYRAAGFRDFDEYVDIMNHAEFNIIIKYRNSDGTDTIEILHGCRVLGPIRPNAPISRGTLRRSLPMMVGYTHKTPDGAR